jgi:hypothetical protein
MAQIYASRYKNFKALVFHVTVVCHKVSRYIVLPPTGAHSYHMVIMNKSCTILTTNKSCTIQKPCIMQC